MKEQVQARSMGTHLAAQTNAHIPGYANCNNSLNGLLLVVTKYKSGWTPKSSTDNAETTVSMKSAIWWKS